MTSDPVAAAATLIEGIVPVDAIEAHHQNLASSWIASTNDIFRRVKPRTPDPHLVSYAVLVDRRRRILLGEHRLAGLWFLLRGDLHQPLHWDRGEFAHQFDPHQARFLNKLENQLLAALAVRDASRMTF